MKGNLRFPLMLSLPIRMGLVKRVLPAGQGELYERLADSPAEPGLPATLVRMGT